MKFANLFKKELKELMTKQMLLSLIIPLIAFYAIGNLMGNVVDDIQEKSTKITICNQDEGVFTDSVITVMESLGNEVTEVELQSDDYVAELERLEIDDVIIIPSGFSKTVLEDKKIADIQYVSKMDTLAMASNASKSGSSMALTAIEEAVKSTLMLEESSVDEVALIEQPINLVETTVVGEKSAEISSDEISAFASMQSMFVPIIIFILLIYSSQMIISAISTEKIDKTLETLLSAPVSRIAVLAAKMSAAAVVAALNAAVYMIGFSKFMTGMTGGELTADAETSNAIVDLGLKLQGVDYVFLGIQMFLTILIALSISLILGALAKDVKSAQTLILPIMFLAMIPYMLTTFVDIKTLSPVIRTLIYAIPFTHTFTAIDNIIFAKDALFWGGVIYQVIALAICMFFAVRVFMTDKIFTMTLSLGQKRSKSSNKSILAKYMKK